MNCLTWKTIPSAILLVKRYNEHCYLHHRTNMQIGTWNIFSWSHYCLHCVQSDQRLLCSSCHSAPLYFDYNAILLLFISPCATTTWDCFLWQKYYMINFANHTKGWKKHESLSLSQKKSIFFSPSGFNTLPMHCSIGQCPPLRKLRKRCRKKKREKIVSDTPHIPIFWFETFRASMYH